MARLLDELAAELQAGRFRPLPARRVFIPKPGSAEQRPLSIPAIRDRVVQAAVKIVIEPIFEADFLPCSFGFRPKRSAHDALQVLVDESFKGKRWVVETDVANCFEAIPHSGLMSAVQERVSDRRLLGLLRAFLRAGVMHEGTVRRAVTGTPQGSLCSAEHKPPWGVPVSVCSRFPVVVMTPAPRNAFTSANTRLSLIRRRTRSINGVCPISSKHAWISASSTHSYP